MKEKNYDIIINMKNKKIFSLFLFVFAFGFYNFASATSTPETTTITTTASSTLPQILGLQTPNTPPIIATVKDAKIKLASITLNHALIPVYKNVKNSARGGSASGGKKTEKTITSYKLGDKDIALAIHDPNTNQTILTVGRLNGKKMIFPDPALDVKLITFNGVNSKFQVNSPANGQIVALKYLISPKESGSKKVIEQSLYEATYVPYSQSFNDPAVLAYGSDYLNGIISKVAQDLQNIPSKSVPGKTITEAITPALIKSLVYAEHTDTNKVLKSPDIKSTIDQLNIIFALNEGDAYKYSVSTADARGIAQFISSTYASLVKNHADANLIPDFVTGMSDHENSIKAMYLLLDDYAGTVRVKAQMGFTEGRVFEYGAASYNGGTSRVAKAVNLFGDTWDQDRSGQVSATQSAIINLKYKIKKTVDKKTKTSLQTQLAEENTKLANLQSGTLRNETVNYLKKIYKVIRYFNSKDELVAYNN